MCVYCIILLPTLVLWFTNILRECYHSPGGGVISLVLEMRELSLKRLISTWLAEGHVAKKAAELKLEPTTSPPPKFPILSTYQGTLPVSRRCCSCPQQLTLFQGRWARGRDRPAGPRGGWPDWGGEWTQACFPSVTVKPSQRADSQAEGGCWKGHSRALGRGYKHSNSCWIRSIFAIMAALFGLPSALFPN